ncbi:MAG: hypothetical protein ABI321_06145 [Polyangia bacterium]
MRLQLALAFTLTVLAAPAVAQPTTQQLSRGLKKLNGHLVDLKSGRDATSLYRTRLEASHPETFVRRMEHPPTASQNRLVARAFKLEVAHEKQIAATKNAIEKLEHLLAR